MIKKTTVRFVALLLIGICGLLLLQALLVPKFMDESKDGALIGEYYHEKADHDVVFIGDCEVYENFSPITLWNEYGITSYIRGSAQQMIWQSYYLMEETFRYETPKAIVFNVLSMKYDSPESTGNQTRREAYNRMTLDKMRWSNSKWNAILASQTQEEKEWNSMWTYLFPILRYHDRWSELTLDDFKYLFHREKISDNGYLMHTDVKPLEGEHMEPPLVDYQFGSNSYLYLDKMTELCKAHGTELILIKAPSLYPVWWDEWDLQIQEYARKNGLKYYNFLDVQKDIGIDWNTDTYDAGLHLNVYGAEKLSSYFGDILSNEFHMPDHRNELEYCTLWKSKTELYNARKELLTSDEMT